MNPAQDQILRPRTTHTRGSPYVGLARFYVHREPDIAIDHRDRGRAGFFHSPGNFDQVGDLRRELYHHRDVYALRHDGCYFSGNVRILADQHSGFGLFHLGRMRAPEIQFGHLDATIFDGPRAILPAFDRSGADAPDDMGAILLRIFPGFFQVWDPLFVRGRRVTRSGIEDKKARYFALNRTPVVVQNGILGMVGEDRHLRRIGEGLYHRSRGSRIDAFFQLVETVCRLDGRHNYRVLELYSTEFDAQISHLSPHGATGKAMSCNAGNTFRTSSTLFKCTSARTTHSSSPAPAMTTPQGSTTML